MALIKSIIILIIGFALLMKGADYFVEGSSSVAKQLHVPSMIIGMTIVAMGTSLPETSVSIAASMNNQNTLAVSNVVGSNIFNLMVVLGICAVISKLQVSRDVLKRYIEKRVSIINYLCGLADGAWICRDAFRTFRWRCISPYFCSLSDLDDWLCQESKSSTQGKSDDARRGRISRRRNSDPATLEMCVIYCWWHDRNQIWRRFRC